MVVASYCGVCLIESVTKRRSGASVLLLLIQLALHAVHARFSASFDVQISNDSSFGRCSSLTDDCKSLVFSSCFSSRIWTRAVAKADVRGLPFALGHLQKLRISRKICRDIDVNKFARYCPYRHAVALADIQARSGCMEQPDLCRSRILLEQPIE